VAARTIERAIYNAYQKIDEEEAVRANSARADLS
jgi:hypothetical protein